MFRRKVKRTSIDIYVEGLRTSDDIVICDYLNHNFDVKYQKHEEEDCVHYRIRATRSERKKLIKFIKIFDGHWFDALIVGNFIELCR